VPQSAYEPVARLRGTIDAHPRHAVLTAIVAGLLVGPRWPGAVPALALAAAVVVWRPPAAAAAAVALIAAAALGAARHEALDHTVLPAAFGRPIRVAVTLLEPPRPRAYGAHAAVARLGDEDVELRASRSVRWPAAVEAGDIVAVAGHLRALGPFEDYLSLRNVHAGLTATAITATGRRRGGLAGGVDAIRRRAERALNRDLPTSLAALYRGMVLGQDAALPPDMRDEFNAAGLSHLVAASGENVVLLSTLGFAVCAALGVGLRARYAIVIGLIVLYVPLAGAGASIQRAGVMGVASVVAAYAGRRSSRVYALLLAAAVTLVVNPRADADAGWQMSFAAVVAIMMLARPLHRRLRRAGLPDALAQAAAITAAATLGTAPIIAARFGTLSLASLPANVAAAPAVAPIMWLGMLASAVAQVSPALAAPLTAAAGLPLAYVAWVAHVAAGVPHANVHAPALWVALGCGAIIALTLAPPRR
jgi:competence protein ComEC